MSLFFKECSFHPTPKVIFHELCLTCRRRFDFQSPSRMDRNVELFLNIEKALKEVLHLYITELITGLISVHVPTALIYIKFCTSLQWT